MHVLYCLRLGAGSAATFVGLTSSEEDMEGVARVGVVFVADDMMTQS